MALEIEKVNIKHPTNLKTNSKDREKSYNGSPDLDTMIDEINIQFGNAERDEER